MGLKEMPVTGAFLRPEVPRGREDLFYKLKDDTDRKYRTYLKLTERDNQAEAQAYINRHPNLVAYYEYTSEMDAQLKEINSAIRFIGETRDPSYTPEIKRREIQEFLNLKQDILEGIEQFRKEAYTPTKSGSPPRSRNRPSWAPCRMMWSSSIWLSFS
jgi:hypothetical protein